MTTYHVRPKAGNDINAGDSYSAAWRTLGAAMRRYRPGDVVHLYDGNHRPAIVQKPRLTLVGHDGAAIDGRLNPEAQHGLLLMASNITIDTLAVRNASGTGIAAARGSQFVTIRNSLVEHNGGHGISLIGGDYYTVEDNCIRFNIGQKSRKVSATSGISVFNPCPGEDIGVAYRIKILRNTVYGNGTTAGTDGYACILDKWGQHNPNPYNFPALIGENTFYLNGNGGLYIYYTNNITVRRNQFWHNGQDTTKKRATEIGLNNARDIILRGNVAEADTDRYVFYSGGPTVNTAAFAGNCFYAKGRTDGIVAPFSGVGQPQPTSPGNTLGADPQTIYPGWDSAMTSSPSARPALAGGSNA